MKTALVGYTGFVGSNLCASHKFSAVYNSKNIKKSYGTEPDLLIYAGVKAEMFIANSHPKEDFEKINEAIFNIVNIKPKRVVLISTVAVYDKTVEVNENDDINENDLLPYGKNRLFLEKWVSETYANSLIVRLPAIYGINLKKNFIYDYINVCPTMLNRAKYEELKVKSKYIGQYYQLEEDGFYHNIAKEKEERNTLRSVFQNIGFSALNFTDSRSVYQFYNLGGLWNDICSALNNNIKLLNLVTEPVSVAEVYRYLTEHDFVNELPKQPYNYDIKSKYSELFNGKDGYLKCKDDVLHDIKLFVEGEIKEKWG